MSVLATYRCPKKAGEGSSRVLSAVLVGDRVEFRGGAYGRHSVAADDPRRVDAHWRGYVANTRGRGAKPRAVTAAALAAATGRPA